MNEDAELVLRTRQGDFGAFETLYHKYKKRVYGTALAITREKSAAEEILQESFIKLFSHIGRLDGSLPLSPWLHRVAVNLSYNWLKKKHFWLVSLDGLVDRLIAKPQRSPEQALEREELRHMVRKAIDSLSFKHRVVIILYYLQDFSLSEIAEILDCPLGTVKSRLHYGRRHLERELRQEHHLKGEMAYEFT
ncbi:MAG: RNA polymerase sigma factor [Anaerolineae bacterium]